VLDYRGDYDDTEQIIASQLASALGLSIVALKFPAGYSDSVTTKVWSLPLFCQNHSLTSSTSGDTSVCVSLNAEIRPSLLRAAFLIGFTPSGAYMVLLTDHTDNADIFVQLHLVHLIRDPPSIQIRPLELPFFIDPGAIFSIAIDDHRGVVLLSDFRGYIFSVPYA
jgi:hypothetical protein